MADVIESDNMHVVKDCRKIPSNDKTNAALTLGIIGTALSVLGTGVGVLGNGKKSNVCDSNLERKQWQDYIDVTKQYYEGRIDGQERLTNAFFDAYKHNVDSSFALYKNQRDSDDAIRSSVDMVATSLSDKINAIDKKVDMMAAIRPYQDALINSKIDNNALIAAYELQKRTCRMIQGELVLPSTPTVTGYPSYIASCCAPVTTPATNA